MLLGFICPWRLNWPRKDFEFYFYILNIVFVVFAFLHSPHIVFFVFCLFFKKPVKPLK